MPIRAAFGVFLTYSWSISVFPNTLLHIVANSVQYRGYSGRILLNPANIYNCFLPVSYLFRRTSRNGLKNSLLSTNPAESKNLSILDDSGDSWSVWNRGIRQRSIVHWAVHGTERHGVAILPNRHEIIVLLPNQTWKRQWFASNYSELLA